MIHGDKDFYFTTSYVSTTRSLHRDLAAKFNRTEQYRIWQITLNNQPTGTNYPSGALNLSEARVIEPGEKLIGDVISASDAFIVEFKENGRWIANTTGKNTNVTGTIGDQAPLPLFSQDTEFFGRMGGSSSTSRGRTNLTINGLTSSGASSTSSLNKTTTLATRSRPSIKPGTLGLGNL